MQNTLTLYGPACVEQYLITQALKFSGQLHAPNKSSSFGACCSHHLCPHDTFVVMMQGLAYAFTPVSLCKNYP